MLANAVVLGDVSPKDPEVRVRPPITETCEILRAYHQPRDTGESTAHTRWSNREAVALRTAAAEGARVGNAGVVRSVIGGFGWRDCVAHA